MRSVVNGFALPFDVVRRFAQPLGIHLPSWGERIIETKKSVVRLIPVTERAEQLFGEAGTEAVAHAIERSHGRGAQFTLFPDRERVPDAPLKGGKKGYGWGRKATPQALTIPREATTLESRPCCHAPPAGGQATALRAMLEAETHRSPRLPPPSQCVVGLVS